MYNSALAKRVKYFKGDRKEGKRVGALSEKIIRDTQKEIARRMIEGGKLALSDIANYTGLSVTTVRRMAKKLEEAQAAQA